MQELWHTIAGFAAFAGLPDWKIIVLHWEFFAAIALGAYILGSIPFGLLLTKLTGRGDIRTIGSGNIGATNVLRTGSKSLAATTLLLDAGKGAVAIVAARTIAGPDGVLIAGSAVFLGHLYPVWLKFNGGKGVATMLGIHLAAAWPIGVVAIAVWLLVALLVRISSAAALAASVAAPIAAAVIVGAPATALAIFLTVFVWIKHGPNIRRLLHGAEPKIKLK